MPTIEESVRHCICALSLCEFCNLEFTLSTLGLLLNSWIHLEALDKLPIVSSEKFYHHSQCSTYKVADCNIQQPTTNIQYPTSELRVNVAKRFCNFLIDQNTLTTIGKPDKTGFVESVIIFIIITVSVTNVICFSHG